jgi:N-acetylmuramoyl-L-alanine amidase
MNNFLRQIFYIIILVFVQNSIQAQNENQESEYKIRTVVIDPGHGGKDPGAIGKISYEKDIVLAIGLKLGKYIEENIPDVKVIYTRKTDEFIPLYRRAEIANENNADLFISIHANGGNDPLATGTESLVLGLHRSDENFEVAKRENSVILMEEDYSTRYENFDPNSLESYIIFSLMQNIYDNQSISFAGLVQDQFRDRAKRKDRGVRRQGLLVLAQTSMPGVLIETGFITNSTEEEYLTSEDGQDYIASAIYRAFKDYKNDIEMKSGDVLANHKTSPDNRPDSLKSDSTRSITNNSIPENPSVYFKVQIAVSSEAIPLNSEQFKDLSELEEFRTNKLYKYAVGYKSSYEEILEYSKWVRNRFPDAFIIAVKNGNIVPVKEVINTSNLN